MITVFHGEDVVASRNALVAAVAALKQKLPGVEVININGDRATLTEISNRIDTPNLFAVPSALVMEKILSRRPSNEKTAILKYLNSLSQPIVIWESAQASAASIAVLDKKTTKIQQFKLAKSIFKLLDNLRPGNSLQIIKLLTDTLATESAELVSFMLAKRVLQLILATSSHSNALSGLAPWQQAQISQQAKYWTSNQLKNFHRRLVSIEQAIKFGSTPMSLADHLDIALASL